MFVAFYGMSQCQRCLVLVRMRLYQRGHKLSSSSLEREQQRSCLCSRPAVPIISLSIYLLQNLVHNVSSFARVPHLLKLCRALPPRMTLFFPFLTSFLWNLMDLPKTITSLSLRPPTFLTRLILRSSAQAALTPKST